MLACLCRDDIDVAICLCEAARCRLHSRRHTTYHTPPPPTSRHHHRHRRLAFDARLRFTVIYVTFIFPPLPADWGCVCGKVQVRLFRRRRQAGRRRQEKAGAGGDCLTGRHRQALLQNQAVRGDIVTCRQRHALPRTIRPRDVRPDDPTIVMRMRTIFMPQPVMRRHVMLRERL